MDIYEFIESWDVAEHCRKINHQFNPCECAVLVFDSMVHTLEEKHVAYREIIAGMPDMPIEVSYNEFSEPLRINLREFLKRYMEIENRLVSEFYNEKDAVYSYTCGDGSCVKPFCDRGIFRSVDDCVRDYEKRVNRGSEPVPYIKIYKKSTEPAEYNHLNYLYLMTDSLKPSIVNYYRALSEEERKIFYLFEDIKIDVPVPFKRGDILYFMPSAEKPAAFVFDETRKGNRHVYGYMRESLTASGRVFNDGDAIVYGCHPARSSDLSYYTGELKGNDRLLIPISNYLKNNIGLAMLLNAYAAMLHDRTNSEYLRYFLRNEDNDRRLAGVEEMMGREYLWEK